MMNTAEQCYSVFTIVRAHKSKQPDTNQAIPIFYLLDPRLDLRNAVNIRCFNNGTQKTLFYL